VQLIHRSTHEDVLEEWRYTRVYPKVSRLRHNEVYAYKNKHSLRSNTKGYGDKTR